MKAKEKAQHRLWRYLALPISGEGPTTSTLVEEEK